MRVILSMTSIPSRLPTIGRTLDSLRLQTRHPDEIRLHLGPDCPAFEAAGVQVRRGQDHGPVSKLLPAVDGSLAAETLIITVDDDQIYDPEWLDVLVEAAETTDAAIGMAGWLVAPLLAGQGFGFIRPPGDVDVLEGFAGAAYRRGWFAADILAPPPAFRFVDDVWVSSYLRRRGVRRHVLNRRMCRDAIPDAPGLHTRPDFLELNREAARLGFPK